MRSKIKDNRNLEDVNLDIHGRPKRTVASFQIDYKLWNEFDSNVEEEYGKYKKSFIIEDLIRKYMAKKTQQSQINK
jgi:metal-responsive CopG/Arc/MetJ family transcriptional regulator